MSCVVIQKKPGKFMGWESKTSLEDLITIMVRHDIEEEKGK